MKSKKTSAPSKRTPRKPNRDSHSVRVLEPEVLSAEESDATESAEEISPEAEDAAIEADIQTTLEEKLPVATRHALGELEPSLPPSEDDDTEASISPGALSISDPLRRYLEEVRRYPLLSAEQELDLVLKLRNSGDLSAAKALVSANLRLVVKIAFEYKSLYTNIMDLIQEGNVGLMKAVSKYDPSKGARLGYYASWWIKSYILKYLLDNFRLIKIGTTQAQKKLFYHLMREKELLEAQGIRPEPKLLASRLDVKEKDVVEMEARLGARGGELSLDAPMSVDGDGQAAHYLDFLAADQESADEKVAREELVGILRAKLPEFEKSLNEKEKRLLRERLLNDDPRTLQEVADEYGLTRERARQIEAKVVFKLKQYLGF